MRTVSAMPSGGKKEWRAGSTTSAETWSPNVAAVPRIIGRSICLAGLVVDVFSVDFGRQIVTGPLIAIFKLGDANSVPSHAGLEHGHGHDFGHTDISDSMLAQRLEIRVRHRLVECGFARKKQKCLRLLVYLLRVLEIENLHYVVLRHPEMLNQVRLMIIDAARAVDLGRAYE